MKLKPLIFRLIKPNEGKILHYRVETYEKHKNRKGVAKDWLHSNRKVGYMLGYIKDSSLTRKRSKE